MANRKMFLFWGSGSAPCWRPMIVLAEKGLWKGLPNKLISFEKEETKSAEIKWMNPRCQVPVFRDGDIVLNESNAICWYLENKYSNDNNRLTPDDAVNRARMYQRIFECENLINNVINPIMHDKLFADKDKVGTDGFKAAQKELKLWNSYLEGSEYLAGEMFSLVDAVFYPYLAYSVRKGVNLEPTKNLEKYYDTVKRRQSVQETWPPHWQK